MVKADYENYFPRLWGPYYDPGNRLARRIILKLISEHLYYSTCLLDIGGGVGDLLVDIHKLEHFDGTLILVDISFDTLEKAKYCGKAYGVSFYMVQGDASELPIKSDAINIITCRETLEHIKDDKSAAQEMFRILKFRGKALIQVPVESKPSVWLGHFRCYTKKKLSRLFDEIGFEVIECIFICKLARFVWGYPKFLIYIVWLLLTGNIIKRIKKVEFLSYYNSWFHKKIVMPLFDKILAIDYIFSVRGNYKSGANILVVGRKS